MTIYIGIDGKPTTNHKDRHRQPRLAVIKARIGPWTSAERDYYVRYRAYKKTPRSKYPGINLDTGYFAGPA